MYDENQRLERIDCKDRARSAQDGKRCKNASLPSRRRLHLMAMMSIYDYDMQELSIMFDYTLFADILA